MAKGDGTKLNLIESAVREFGELGFEGTNTNRIARRAGYAPQTFYRHFADKLAVFLAVYEQWYRENIESVANAPDRLAIALSVVRNHRMTLHFRRSLRHLASNQQQVADARAASRNFQIDRLAAVLPHKSRIQLAVLLLTIERLADGIAEGEFADLDLSEADAVEQLCACFEWIK